MSTTGSYEIVVGIDGSASALGAAWWAAARAQAWNAPLRLVHARTTDPAALASAPGPLAAAAEVVRSVAPQVPVTLALRYRPPESLLLAESVRARLIVLGSREMSDRADLGPGTVATAVSARGHCPVVVVRGRGPAEPPPLTGPIVVGVDGSHYGDAALGFAFELAWATGDPLIAVHTWTETGVGDGGWTILPGGRAEIEAARKTMLAARLAPWRTKYPEVVVHERVVHDRPVRGLLAATNPMDGPAAQLLVVGSRGQLAPHGMGPGSTSRALLRSSECPIAVARPDQLDHARPARFRAVSRVLGARKT